MKKLLTSLTSLFGKSKTELTDQQPSEAPSFQPTNRLEEMLVAAANDPAARPAFLEYLLDEQLFVITDHTTVEREFIATEGETINIRQVPTPDGEHAAAVFTSLERISSLLSEPAGYASMKGRDLLDLVSPTGAWLNPTFPYSVHWSSEDLHHLLGKPVSWSVEEDTTVLLGEPANHPTQLVDFLTQTLSQAPHIHSAWLALAQWPQRERFSWYLDIRTTQDRASVLSLLDGLQEAAATTGLSLDVVINTPSDAEGQGIRILPSSASLH